MMLMNMTAAMPGPRRERDAVRKSLRFPTAALAGCIGLLALWAGSEGWPASDAPAALNLSIVDAATKEQIPGRVEVLDRDGKAYVSPDALLIGGD